MISREIEKEIKQENKVLLNLTMRQVICLSVAVICSVLIAVFLGLDFEIAVYPCLVIGILCFVFGWMKQDGIPMERVLVKRLQVYFYQNAVRVYKTRNRYVVMLNREYERRRQMDGRDKKLRKMLKREKKEANRLRKHSALDKKKLR